MPTGAPFFFEGWWNFGNPFFFFFAEFSPLMVKFFDFLEVQRAFAGSYDHQCAFDGRGDTEADETATEKKHTPPKTNMECKSGGLEDDFLLQGVTFKFHVSLGGSI